MHNVGTNGGGIKGGIPQAWEGAEGVALSDDPLGGPCEPRGGSAATDMCAPSLCTGAA